MLRSRTTSSELALSFHQVRTDQFAINQRLQKQDENHRDIVTVLERMKDELNHARSSIAYLRMELERAKTEITSLRGTVARIDTSDYAKFVHALNEHECVTMFDHMIPSHIPS